MKNALRILLLAAVGLSGCVGIPPGLEAVDGFDVSRYTGSWYEIVRLDHNFERGLTNVTATYTPREDGGIDVLNRGFDPAKEKWKAARGRAYFIGERDVARLRVSFFRPFYGGYNVIDLDRENYSWSMVAGPKRTYFWILAREPVLEGALLEELVRRAGDKGFDTDALIYMDHADLPPEAR